MQNLAKDNNCMKNKSLNIKESSDGINKYKMENGQNLISS